MAVIYRQGQWADLDFSEVSEFMHDSLRGVEALHEAGIAHRDIKPGNILVSHAGRLALTDFDASCLIHESGALSNTFSTTHLCCPTYIRNYIHRGGWAGMGFCLTMCILIPIVAQHDPHGIRIRSEIQHYNDMYVGTALG